MPPKINMTPELARQRILQCLSRGSKPLSHLSTPHVYLVTKELRDSIVKQLIAEKLVTVDHRTGGARVTLRKQSSKPEVVIAEDMTVQCKRFVQVNDSQYLAPTDDKVELDLGFGDYLFTFGSGSVKVRKLVPTAEPARNQMLEEEKARLKGLVQAYEQKQKDIEKTWGALTGLLDNNSLVK